MPVEKVNCGVRPLKKGERRGTMQECVDKKQIRYYGIKTIDKVLLNEVLGKKKPEKADTELKTNELRGKMTGMISKVKRLRPYQESAKKKGDTKDAERLEKEINQLKAKFNKLKVLLVKREKEEKEENEKKDKEKKDKEKKDKKRSSKKSSKKND